MMRLGFGRKIEINQIYMGEGTEGKMIPRRERKYGKFHRLKSCVAWLQRERERRQDKMTEKMNEFVF